MSALRVDVQLVVNDVAVEVHVASLGLVFGLRARSKKLHPCCILVQKLLRRHVVCLLFNTITVSILMIIMLMLR